MKLRILFSVKGGGGEKPLCLCLFISGSIWSLSTLIQNARIIQEESQAELLCNSQHGEWSSPDDF